MSFLTRAFAPADLPTLHAIRAAAFAPIFASFRSIVGPEIAALGLATAEQEQADLLDAIAKLDSSHAIAIAESGSTVIGFVSWKNDPATKIGEITLNAVHPGHAGESGHRPTLSGCLLERDAPAARHAHMHHNNQGGSP